MKKIIKTGLLALCFIMFMTAQTYAAGTSFKTEGTKVGENIEVVVSITEGTAYSGEIVIEYDTDVLEYVKAELTSGVSETLIWAANEEDGQITIGFADYSSKPVQGNIVKLTFKTLVTEPAGGYVLEVAVEEWSGEEINSEVDELAYVNYDVVVKNGEAAILNMDVEGDGTADVNIDTDGDGTADINIDTNNDGQADVDIDTDGDGKPDKNLSNTGSDDEGKDTNDKEDGDEDDVTEEDDTSEEDDTTGEEDDTSEEDDATGEEDDNEDSKDDATSEKDENVQTDADAEEPEARFVVWPFVLAGVVIVIAIVGWMFYKKAA